MEKRKVTAVSVEPQVDRSVPSDDVGAYLPNVDVVGYEKAYPDETPDLWAVMVQLDDPGMAEWEWELLEDFDTEQEARMYAAEVIKRGWC